MAGRKEEAYYDEARRLYVKEGKTLEQMAALLPVSLGSLSKWKGKGAWEKDRRAHLASPRDIAEQLRRTLEKKLAALGDKETLDPADFDAINKCVAAIRSIERAAVDLRVMAVEVMKEFTDWLRGQQLAPGELQLIGGFIRAWFRSLE